MPIKRKSLRQTSIVKKCLAYETARKRELHKSRYGWRNFRVLFVTDEPKRAANLLEAIAKHPQLMASPLFLVSDAESLAAADNILTHQWKTLDNKTASLI